MSTVIVNNLATSYEIIGTGKTVLWLHGWGDSRATFKGLITFLDYKSVLLDLPGFGGTEIPDAAWGLDEYANFVSIFCQKINIEPDIIVGHSNGGAVAIKSISMGILKPSVLVLLASAGIRNNHKTKKYLYRIMAKVAKTALTLIPKQKSIRFKKKMYDKIGSDINVAPNMEETFKKIINQDILNDSIKIKIPTLIVYGGNDKYTPKEYGELLEKNISNSRLIVLSDCGHFLHQDNPKEISIFMKEFINAN
ncbi:MAG: alpha/beta hydrolase [Patescibacteria group bacterium]|jgi:4,5:9,10-diseco-3-hydroxy-5,9,17-trioxoandrosta-1(10),2-diene-4-oate hydrolase|nr:alpha/beta hydrolase [Patescibacteria group bacterium]